MLVIIRLVENWSWLPVALVLAGRGEGDVDYAGAGR